MNAFNPLLGEIIIYRKGTDAYFPGMITQVNSSGSMGVMYYERDRVHYIRAIFGDKPGQIRCKDNSSHARVVRNTSSDGTPHDEGVRTLPYSGQNPGRGDPITGGAKHSR